MKKQRWLFVFFSVVLLLCCSVAPASAATVSLPATGQTKCYDTAGTEIACAGTGQDGAYNINPMSYTDNGNGTIADNVTSLMWQKGENATSYNWYQASGTYDATNNPSSQNVCGSLTLAGQSGWRLPTMKELITIVDYSIPYPGPTINTTYFPNTNRGAPYWSSTTWPSGTSDAWYVSFNGYDVGLSISWWNYPDVRCVHGRQSAPSFTNNGNGTVTDAATGLMWQQGEPGFMPWADALTYCESLSLGGQTDWRLPNIKELKSITDDTKDNPTIDTTFFPNTNTYYWSSTTLARGTGDAWYVFFGGGYDSGSSRIKSGDSSVRCIRGGQSGSSQNNCAATLSGSFLLHEPYFTINGSFLSLDLQYAQDTQFSSTDIMFKLSNAGGVTNPADYSNCQASALTITDNNYVLHIPILILGSTSCWLDLTYMPTSDGLLWFKLTGFGAAKTTNTYTITSSSGTGGSISPSTP